MIAYVAQEHPYGCGIACLAMLTGRPYADIHDIFEHNPDTTMTLAERDGLYHTEIDWFLATHGYVWRYMFAGWSHDPWPPEPFAPIHFASVRQPSGNHHYVVVLADGTVLDPLRSGAYDLSEWEKVNNVLGVWPEPSHNASSQDVPRG